MVLLIAICSSQLKNLDGKCDTNKWNEYTETDCSNAYMEGFILTIQSTVSSMSTCKDASGAWLVGLTMETMFDTACGSKGTTKAVGTKLKDTA